MKRKVYHTFIVFMLCSYKLQQTIWRYQRLLLPTTHLSETFLDLRRGHLPFPASAFAAPYLFGQPPGVDGRVLVRAGEGEGEGAALHDGRGEQLAVVLDRCCQVEHHLEAAGALAKEGNLGERSLFQRKMEQQQQQL